MRHVPLPPFQMLVDRHANSVLRFLVSAVGAVDADDCFQETMLAALRAYPRLRDQSNLRGWLLTIARRKVIDAQRAAARRPLTIAEPDSAVATPELDRADDGLWDSVQTLPDKQRRAVVLRYAEDRSYRDIARALSVSEDAARQNVHAGLKKLRREVQ